jgi:hypothetical protein
MNQHTHARTHAPTHSPTHPLSHRYPTKRLRLKLDGQQWVDGTPVHGSYYEFRNGAPFRFPVEVEVTSVFGEVLTDWIDSIAGGRSRIQYRREPTDAELAAAQPGEEPNTDDDIEESPGDSEAGTAPPPPAGALPLLEQQQLEEEEEEEEQQQQQQEKAAAPVYETLSVSDAAEEAEYRMYAPAAPRRRPFLGEEEEDEEEPEARWENQYLRGRGRRSI